MLRAISAAGGVAQGERAGRGQGAAGADAGGFAIVRAAAAARPGHAHAVAGGAQLQQVGAGAKAVAARVAIGDDLVGIVEHHGASRQGAAAGLGQLQRHRFGAVAAIGAGVGDAHAATGRHVANGVVIDRLAVAWAVAGAHPLHHHAVAGAAHIQPVVAGGQPGDRQEGFVLLQQLGLRGNQRGVARGAGHRRDGEVHMLGPPGVIRWVHQGESIPIGQGADRIVRGQLAQLRAGGARGGRPLQLQAVAAPKGRGAHAVGAGAQLIGALVAIVDGLVALLRHHGAGGLAGVGRLHQLDGVVLIAITALGVGVGDDDAPTRRQGTGVVEVRSLGVRGALGRIRPGDLQAMAAAGLVDHQAVVAGSAHRGQGLAGAIAQKLGLQGEDHRVRGRGVGAARGATAAAAAAGGVGIRGARAASGQQGHAHQGGPIAHRVHVGAPGAQLVLVILMVTVSLPSQLALGLVTVRVPRVVRVQV